MDPGGRTSSYTPSGAFGAYLTGRFALQRADLETAADKLEQASREAAPAGVREVQVQAFMAQVMAGRLASGQAGAVLLARSLPDNPVAQLVLADADALAGRWEDAEARFAGLSQQQGLTQVLRPLLVAWAQAGAGRTAAALGTLQPWYEQGRLRGVMALHAAMIADAGGQAADAARLYRLAQAEYGGVNLRLGVVLASWQARTGFAGEAQRTIRELGAQNGDIAMARAGLEADVGNRAVRDAKDGIAEAYLAMAATLRQQNATDTAQVLMQLALSMRPDFTSVRLLLADTLEGARRPEAALAALGNVDGRDPLRPVVRMRQAALQEALGRTDEALATLEELARAQPDRAEPLALAGGILRQKTRFKESAAYYDRAVARLGTPSRANWALFYERGVSYERAGMWAEAERDFEAALQLSPEQPSVLNYLGYAWTEQGKNLVRARQMIERAVALRPEDGSYLDSLGWVLLKQGDAAGALARLQRAVELQSEDPVINGHYGDALAAVGRWREAEFQWRRALLLKPEPEEEARITRRLGALPKAGPGGVSTEAVGTRPSVR